MRKFDLNIEKILENWEVKHAVREIIANALDEQKLSGTKEIQIYKDKYGAWIIRDFGRGLKYEHLTQKENEEKLKTEGIIGKFGIGLKDALATFERRSVSVKIFSKHCDITIGRAQKSEFNDLITLHAYIDEPSNPNMEGTMFQLINISDNEIEQAKQLFMIFNTEKILEKTRYGEVLLRKGNMGNIYINGVLAATEENFLFSYNITSLNAQLRKALNRERTNIGRTAYSSIVKNMLLECQTQEIGYLLAEDLKNYDYGSLHDELKWIEVQQHAANILNKYRKVVFVTTEDAEKGTDLINEARQGGFEVITIPKNLKEKLEEKNLKELEKNPDGTNDLIRTLAQFQVERSKNFEFKFVAPEELTFSERKIWDLIPEILQIIGGKPVNVKEIVISEIMQRDTYTFRPSEGLWDREGKIIIKRSALSSREHFIGVLLHELAHARSGAADATREFESELTELIGILGAKAISQSYY